MPGAERTSDLIGDDECYINCPPVRTAYEWHRNDTNDSALKKAKRFHLQNEELYAQRHCLIAFLLRSNTTVKDSIYAFQKGYLDDIDMSQDTDSWREIEGDLKVASERNEPRDLLRGYSRSQMFSQKINGDMARNTYHALTLYCTPLNCNVLARTQDGIDAFVAILFHPNLNIYLCKKDITLYRGSVLKDGSVLNGYEKGSIIITTTFLSTSEDRIPAEVFSIPDPRKTNQISLFCEYKIHNYRRTALMLKEISQHPDEDEILIYPYVPFKILSLEKTIDLTGNERVKVCFEEVGEWKDGNNDSINMNKYH